MSPKNRATRSTVVSWKRDNIPQAPEPRPSERDRREGYRNAVQDGKMPPSAVPEQYRRSSW